MVESANGGFYFKCIRCKFSCSDEKMIWKHECRRSEKDQQKRKSHHHHQHHSHSHDSDDAEKTNLHVCSICGAYLSTLIDFNEHMLDHCKVFREEGVYECVLCVFKSVDETAYSNHLSEHSWSSPFYCSLCEYKSTKLVRMKSHAVKHLECKGPSHFECLICNKICGTRNSLEKHKQRHKKNYDFKCVICGLTFRHRSALSQHTVTHTKERMFLCTVCGLRYDTKHALDAHVKVHFRDNRLFCCHVCGTKFRTKNILRKHVLTEHDGVKSFKCDLCSESFVFRYTMLKHRKTHGSQMYVCGYCNKQFKSPHYLKTHCAIHEGKNPFVCTSCDFSAPSKVILKKHMMIHSFSKVVNLLSCEHCNYVTFVQSEMEHHITLCHPTTSNQSSMMIIVTDTQ